MNSTSNLENKAFVLTDQAAKQIETIRLSKKDDRLLLRVEVIGGGCAGFQYRFSWVSPPVEKDDELIVHKSGVSIVIDKTSLEFMHGSVLDYQKELIGSWFQVQNPNVSSKCGCGASFGV